MSSSALALWQPGCQQRRLSRPLERQSSRTNCMNDIFVCTTYAHAYTFTFAHRSAICEFQIQILNACPPSSVRRAQSLNLVVVGSNPTVGVLHPRRALLRQVVRWRMSYQQKNTSGKSFLKTASPSCRYILRRPWAAADHFPCASAWHPEPIATLAVWPGGAQRASHECFSRFCLIASVGQSRADWILNTAVAVQISTRLSTPCRVSPRVPCGAVFARLATFTSLAYHES